MSWLEHCAEGPRFEPVSRCHVPVQSAIHWHLVVSWGKVRRENELAYLFNNTVSQGGTSLARFPYARFKYDS